MIIQLVKYQMGLKRQGQTNADLWWPNGEECDCDVDVAMQRYERWASQMKRGKTFMKAPIEYVFIRRVAVDIVMLAEWPDGFQIGPWAAKGAAA